MARPSELQPGTSWVIRVGGCGDAVVTVTERGERGVRLDDSTHWTPLPVFLSMIWHRAP